LVEYFPQKFDFFDKLIDIYNSNNNNLLLDKENKKLDKGFYFDNDENEDQILLLKK